MRGLIRRRLAWAVGVTSLAAIAAIAIASISNAAPSSVPLHGSMRDIHNFGGPFGGPPCPSATGICSSFNATGSINGDGVVFVDSGPTFPGGLSTAHTVIHTDKGDLTCHETAVFNLAGDDPHAFVDLCVIDGSTGLYAGASGYIQEVGTFDFGARVGQLDYYGRLILGG